MMSMRDMGQIVDKDRFIQIQGSHIIDYLKKPHVPRTRDDINIELGDYDEAMTALDRFIEEGNIYVVNDKNYIKKGMYL